MKTIYQPIHPSIRAKLDPEYVAFHDEFLQYVKPNDQEPWDPASRKYPSPVTMGSQKQMEVGSVVDQDLGNFQARIFTPEGEVPEQGWPVLVWLHGGGWVMGGLNSENGFLRHACKHVSCMVVTINYRHAPEHPYPAAAEDSFAGFKWILDQSSSLKINTNKVAIGGLSAGGSLAAVLAMKIAEAGLDIKPQFMLLICPVIDSTADINTGWSKSQYAPWLTPARMKWYRTKYFVDPADAADWDGSPCFAPADLLAKTPKCFIAVAECDLLAPEALAYGESLNAAGVNTTVKVYKGATHSLLVLAGLHEISKTAVHDACAALAQEFGTSYDQAAASVLPMDK